MKNWKKLVILGAVCYVGYKLGEKYLKENDMTPCDVVHKVRDKAKEAAERTMTAVKEKKAERDAREAARPKTVYPFGNDKRMEIVKLDAELTGLFDSRLNFPVEKQVRSYSEEEGVLYVYADHADYVIRDPFFLTVYVKDTAAAAERALELGQYYTDEEAAVYAYGKDKPYPLKAETDGAENPAADGTGEPGAAEAAAGPDETGKPEASEA
ncbi:MAG: hypothetical protein LKJ97_02355 [Succiniclasticum sp.]|jgi:hypothetical protein|nr:hypothetical protein [Succiniclasticum sp.]MCI6222579.1 hypothetical protein [Selenomonadales bacterium]MDY2870073.1 hypothetical protein [Succiniclasticum sp.]MDY6303755.1 hypothetical protein [Succiniclasticum sp.]MDY6345669.1 hypothetical protein [Succiniclasticum sp.]